MGGGFAYGYAYTTAQQNTAANNVNAAGPGYVPAAGQHGGAMGGFGGYVAYEAETEFGVYSGAQTVPQVHQQPFFYGGGRKTAEAAAADDATNHDESSTSTSTSLRGG